MLKPKIPMKITSKNNSATEVHTVGQLHAFLMQNEVRTIKNVVSFPNHIFMQLEQLITNTAEISLFRLKAFLKKLFGRTSFRTTKYWTDRGYSYEEAVAQVSESQRNNSLVLAQLKKHNPEKYKLSNPKNINYWLNKGYSEKEARANISKSQSTFSLEKCIAKHGEIEGKKIWQARQKKWLKSLFNRSNEEIKDMNTSKGRTHEQLIEKHGLEKAEQIRQCKIITYDKMLLKHGQQKADEWSANRMAHIITINPKKVSKISLELFEEIMKHTFKDKPHAMYGDNEMCIKNPNRKFYLFDFAVNSNKTKKVIEFHGDYIHANPKKYFSDWFHPLKKITAKEIWDADKLKQTEVENCGFQYMIIWESEFKANKNDTINKCLQFLNE